MPGLIQHIINLFRPALAGKMDTNAPPADKTAADIPAVRYGAIPKFDFRPCLTERFDKAYADGQFENTEVTDIYKLKDKISLSVAKENFGCERVHKNFYAGGYFTMNFTVYRIFSDPRLRYYKLEEHVYDGCDADEDGFGMEHPEDIFMYIREGNEPMFPIWGTGFEYIVMPKLKEIMQRAAYENNIELDGEKIEILSGNEPGCPECRKLGWCG